MKRAFTMVELIMTIVIMGILAGGAYVSIAKLYAKSAKSKAISELSLQSTLISNQIANLLYERIPSTVIGYNKDKNTFESIYTISENYTILEWISTDYEAFRSGMYSGFIDLDKCNPDTSLLYSPGTDINATERAVIFAGAFDEGDVIYNESDFNASYGWHGNNAKKIFTLKNSSSGENLYLTTKPEIIYEKYDLVKTAYAIGRYPDINKTANCIQNMNLTDTISEHTLFLFYDYKPWEGETFCADPNGSKQRGKVTILSTEASGFEVDFVNGALQFNLTLTRIIRRPGKDFNLTISKQKVVY